MQCLKSYILLPSSHRGEGLFVHITPLKKALNMAINCRGETPWYQLVKILRPPKDILKQATRPTKQGLWNLATNCGHLRSAGQTPAVYAIE